MSFNFQARHVFAAALLVCALSTVNKAQAQMLACENQPPHVPCSTSSACVNPCIEYVGSGAGAACINGCCICA
jgi:hypothetical protein